MSEPFTRRFVPLVGHWNEKTGITRTGALVVTWHVSGYAADLESSARLAMRVEAENIMVRNSAAPGLVICTHRIRRPVGEPPPLPQCHSWYARRFDDEYREHCLQQGYANDVFITLLSPPATGAGAGFRELLRSMLDRKSGSKGPFSRAAADESRLRDFEDIVSKFDAAMSQLGPRRLGMRCENGVWFSELGEAHYMFANGGFRPIPLTCGDLGALLVQDRYVWGSGAFEQRGPNGSLFGAALMIKEYPARTQPLMFDDLQRTSDCSIVKADSFIIGKSAQALDRLGYQVKAFMSANDPAASQLPELHQLRDDIAARRTIPGSHSTVVVVRAKSLDELDRCVSRVQAIMTSAGLTVVREDTALKAAALSVFPGSERWSPRRATINSRNYASMAPLSNVPAGSRRHRWGSHLMWLRTTAETPYGFGFHVTDVPTLPAEDVGSLFMAGPVGSGKTSLLGGMLLSAERQGARIVFIDKDCGLAAMTQATGGVYLVLPAGKPSGLAPLRGLSDTPEERSFLEKFVRSLILSDEGKGLTPDEDGRLKRAVALQMRMPPEMRTLQGVAGMLGQRNMEGAGARLKRWCRGGRLGWAFDGERDDLRFNAPLIGFDTTALLKDPTVSAPTLTYLFYRISNLLDGTPFVLAIDEFWQAFKVPAFAEMAEDQIRTIRKKEGVVLMATQSPGDLVRSPIAQLFKQNVPTKIFFGDESAVVDDLADLDLTPQEIRVVKNTLPLMRHSFLIKRPGGSVICRFDLSPIRHHVAVLSGRAKTYELMLRLIERFGDRPEDWVPHFEREAPLIASKPAEQAVLKEAAAA